MDAEEAVLVKTCARCGVTFEPGSNRARYCSDDCRKAVRRARTPKAEPVGVVGTRREGFAFRITDPATGRTIEGRWRPRYLDDEDPRDRLGYLDRRTGPDEDLAHIEGLLVFEGSRHGGGIKRVAMRDDGPRRWAIDARGVDIGAAL